MVPKGVAENSLRKVLVSGLLFLCLALFACDNRQASDLPRPKEAESFTFLGLHADSLLTGAVKDDLGERLGSAAVETKTTLELTIVADGLLESYLTDLNRLHRKLNYENGLKLRIEHPTTKLIYRYSALFNYVELFFNSQTHRPLLFRIRAKKDGSGYIATFQQKYGAPQEIIWPSKDGRTYVWKQELDVLVLSLYADVYGNPQFEIMICYAANIEAMVAEEEKVKQEKSRLRKGQNVF